MTKFIEVTNNEGEKVLLNISSIYTVMENSDGRAEIEVTPPHYKKGKIYQAISFTAKESYEEIKNLLLYRGFKGEKC